MEIESLNLGYFYSSDEEDNDLDKNNSNIKNKFEIINLNKNSDNKLNLLVVPGYKKEEKKINCNIL